jgi:uncharacterized cupin superfamily protein
VNEPFNLYSALPESATDEPEAYRGRAVSFGPKIGASEIGGSVYELGPGQRNCPYHYEYGREEWMIVLEGTVTVRHPDGERDYERGDVVCFPEGPAGAHQSVNNTDRPARLLMLSTQRLPAISVYPDSDKIGAFPGTDDAIIVRRSSGVDYWDGES